MGTWRLVLFIYHHNPPSLLSPIYTFPHSLRNRNLFQMKWRNDLTQFALMGWQNESRLLQVSITTKRWPQMICEPLYIDYPCTTSVGFNVQKGALDSCSLNSSLIDFNGEILISVWSRSTGRGQSHLLGRAGHPVCESQSIMLAQCAKKGRKGRKKSLWKRADQNTIPSPY